MARPKRVVKPTPVAKEPEVKPASAPKRKTATKTRAAVKKSAIEVPSARRLYADALFDENKLKQNTDFWYLPGTMNFRLGIDIPFPLQYLIDCRVFPLGNVIQVDGPPMSCKTMLMYEFGRIFKEAGGWLDMVVTEGKLSTSLAQSVIGWDEEALRAFTSRYATDLTHMQQLVKEIMRRADEQTKVKLATGKLLGDSFPVLIGIDSIMGALTAETMKKMDTHGFLGRSFPIEAQELTLFMKATANVIQSKPWTLFLINHRKEAKKDPSNPYADVEFTLPGGKQLQYSATYELIMHANKKRKASLDASGDGGMEVNNQVVNIKNGKNSAGTNSRSLDVRISWRKRLVELPDGTRDSIQLTKFHWNEALTSLLYQWQEGKCVGFAKGTGEQKAAMRTKMDEFIHFRRVPGDRYWSRDLGMTATDASKPGAFGKRLTADKELMERVGLGLGVQTGYSWEAGTSYASARRKMVKLARENADGMSAKYGEAIRKLYEEEDFEDD